MSSGKQYENDIAKRLHRATDDEVKVYTCGYSGNNAFPQPDVLLTTGMENYGLELKKTVSDRFYIDSEDIDQLLDCEGSNTSVWYVVKFTHREPVTIRYFGGTFDDDGFSDLSPPEQFAELFPDCFDPHVTEGGNLRLSKPDTDEWPSAQSGRDDHIAILSALGIKNETSKYL